MKKIIRWLADMSGVTQDIEVETTMFIGQQMHDAGYWYSKYPNLMLCVQHYAKKLMEGNQNLFANQFNEWREKVLNIDKQ